MPEDVVFAWGLGKKGEPRGRNRNLYGAAPGASLYSCAAHVPL